MNTHTHALHFLLPREDVFLHLTDSQSRADTHKYTILNLQETQIYKGQC